MPFDIVSERASKEEMAVAMSPTCVFIKQKLVCLSMFERINSIDLVYPGHVFHMCKAKVHDSFHEKTSVKIHLWSLSPSRLPRRIWRCLPPAQMYLTLFVSKFMETFLLSQLHHEEEMAVPSLQCWLQGTAKACP